MIAQLLKHAMIQAAASDGRWMGSDFVLSLLLGTFPAWALFTLVRGWAVSYSRLSSPCEAIHSPARRGQAVETGLADGRSP